MGKASEKTKVKAKPKGLSPADRALRRAAEDAIRRALDFQAVDLPVASAFLDSSADIVVRRASQQTVEGARRLDAFDALRDSMAPGAYDAARRLEADMRLRRGESDKGRGLSRVDKGNLSHTNDRRLAARDRIKAVLVRTGARDAFLLSELIYPSMPRPDWRATVAYVTAEQNPVAQAAAVRSACANLALAYGVREEA